MKKKMNRVISVFLAVLMVLSIAPLDGLGFGTKALDVSGYSDGSSDYIYGDEYRYTIEADGTITLDYYMGDKAEVTVPSEIDGKEVVWINNYCFYDARESDAVEVTKITIPQNIIRIDNAALTGCSKLEEIIVDENNQYYKSVDGCLFSKDGKSFLQYCAANPRTSYTFPDTVEQIMGWGAFEYADNLTDIVIPDSVQYIDNYTFARCANLKHIELPSTLYKLNDGMFQNCSSLKNIALPESLQIIGWRAFASSGLERIYIPKNVYRIEDKAFDSCVNLTAFDVDPDNPSFSDVDGVLFDKDVKTMIYYPLANDRTVYTVPSSVKEIADYACDASWIDEELQLPKLRQLVLPENLEIIGSSAFEGCTGLTSITIPDSVTSIGYGAFCGCDNLVIYGYIGSAAEEYATKNGFEFRIACDHINTEAFEQVEPKSCIEPGYTAGVYCNDCKQWIEGHEEITIPHTDENGDNICDACKITLCDISVGKTKYVEIKDGEITYLKFIPTISGTYTFSSDSDDDTYGYIFDENKEELTDDDDSGSGYNFSITYYLEKGKTYYFGVSYYDEEEGSVPVLLTLDEADCDHLNTTSSERIEPTSCAEPGYTAGVYCNDCDRWISGHEVITIPHKDEDNNNLCDVCGTSMCDIIVGEAKTIEIKSGEITYLKFIPTESGKYTFTSFSSDDTYGYLFDEDKEEITHNDDGGNGSNFKITYNLVKDTIYYFGARFYDEEDEGSFDVLLTVNDGSDDFRYEIENGEAEITEYTGDGGDVTIPSTFGGYPVTSIGDCAFEGCTGLTSVTIPSSVTSIGYSAFKGCTGLTSVTIPNSVTSIGSRAFYGTGYYDDESNWDNSVLYIGNHLIKADSSIYGSYSIKDCTKTIADSAFSDCTDLKSVTIPNSVTSIGENAFYDCTGLTSVTIPSSVTSIGYCAFCSCTGLTSITIPNSVKSIADWAFCNCTGLTSVTIPDSVTSISEYAFYRCTGLTSVTIPSSVTSIGYCAFCSCTGLTSITIPNSVTSIGEGAFEYCAGLASITVDSENTVYDSRDNCNAIIETETNTLISGCKNTVIPNSVKNIGDSAFGGCTGLTSITIPNSVTSIGDSAFARCTGLTSVTIPSSVTSIGDFAFEDCTGLTSVTIPNSVKSIGGWAFDGCTGLTSVTIPDSVTSIGDCAFWGCTGLTSITIPNSVTSIGGYAFAGCTGLTSITIPNSVESIGDYAFGYFYDDESDDYVKVSGFTIYGYTGTAAEEYATENGFTFISLDEGEDNKKDFRYEIENGEATITEYTGDGGAVTIPSTLGGYPVTSIGEYAFKYCESLASVTIGNSVTSIGGWAFSDCTGLTSITIPNSVTSIGNGAFSGCTGLTSITVDSENTVYDSRNNCNAIIETATNTLISGCKNTVIPDSVTSIGNEAFSCCNGLTSVTIPDSVKSIGNGAFVHCTSLTSITIPDSVTSVGYRVFAGCTGLTSITIGNSVTSIGDYAFYGCTGLTSITIPNSVKSIGWSAFSGCTGLTSVTIGNSVESIDNEAFYGCTGLTSITIPNSVTSIGEDAFGYFYDYEGDKVPGFTIYGYTGTAAEEYATENGFTFVALTPTEHVHSPSVYTKPSTCKVQGYELTTCSECKEQLDYKVLPLGEHKFGDWYVEKEPTITEAGLKVRACSVCGKREEEPIMVVPSETVKDEKTGITVSYSDEAYDDKVEVVVSEEFGGKQYLGQSYGKYVEWNISTYVDGVEVQPSEPVLVRIPIPEGFDKNNIAVYHVNTKTGKAEKMEITVENGYISFYTSSFSPYIIVDEKTSEEHCTCGCHKGGISGFFFKIKVFFWKLFRSEKNRYCACGKAHW